MYVPPTTLDVDLHQAKIKSTAPVSYSSKMLDANGGTSCDEETKLLIKETAATLYAGATPLYHMSHHS